MKSVSASYIFSSMGWRRSLAIIFCAFLVFFCSLNAEATKLFRKQSGSVTMAGTNSVVPILQINTSKSFLIFSVSGTSDAAGDLNTDLMVGGAITSSTQITFSRDAAASGTVIVSWQVFEFSSGVTVQRGIAGNIGAPTDIAIASVDLTKSFPIVSGYRTATDYGTDDNFSADITSSTNLRLTADASGTYSQAYWQVVQYDDAVVKRVTAILSGTSTTSTISPPITTLSKAMVLSNHTITGASALNASDIPQTILTNTSTVTYTRNTSTGTIEFVTYIIEFTDNTTVATGVANFIAGDITKAIPITASLTGSGVFPPGNFGRQGSSTASDENLGYAWFSYEITKITNLNVTRGVGTSFISDAPYQIVTFENEIRTYYSIASGAWEANTSWSLSSDGSSGALPVGEFPSRVDNVVIRTGDVITVNDVKDNYYDGVKPDDLNKANAKDFESSNVAMFYHTGDILINGTLTVTAGRKAMLGGYTQIASGGTLTTSSTLVLLGQLEADAGSTLNTQDDLILTGNSITIINTNSTSSDDLIIDHTDATLCGTGSAVLQNGSGSEITYSNGGTINQVCTSFTIACSGVGCDSSFPTVGTTSVILGNIGPGGIGNATNNSLWLKANAGTSTTTNSATISSWNDQSGNANNALQGMAAKQPVYQASVLNNMPALLYDAVSPNSDELVVADNDNLDNTNGLTILTVTKVITLGGNVHAILSKRADVDDNQAYTFFYYSSNHINIDVDKMNDRFTTNFTFVNNTPYIANLYYDGTLAAASRSKVYVNGSLDVTHTETSSTLPNYTSSLTIGSMNINDDRPFNGHIAEVIIYRKTLNDAQRIIADNYLSAKYNIGLSANDVYTMDNAGLDFDFEVAGIGMAANGSYHRDAKGSGIVRMWSPQNLGVGEFLLWGHNNITLLQSTTTVGTSVDGTVIKERLKRIWAVSETGDVGNVSVSFDLSSFPGTALGSNLRLLIDRDGDGFADNDVAPVAGSVANNAIVFSGVHFQNGDRFTLGNTDNSMPLPIQLVSFTATPQSGTVLLKWRTASELNNDVFHVLRSRDAEVWSSIGEVNGAGTSNEVHNYQLSDLQPLDGKSYYMLKQTDFDGKISYSSIVGVDRHSTELINLVVAPNPSTGLFTIPGGRFNASQVEVLNIFGKPVHFIIGIDGDTTIDLSTQPAGMYILRIRDSQRFYNLRLIKE